MKVVYYNQYGGFHLPKEIRENYALLKGINTHDVCIIGSNIERHDPMLVKATEQYLHEFDSSLDIEDIGEADRYYIEEYDGSERVYTDKTLPWIYINKDKE